MKFSYFPGCSLSATGRAYGESTCAVAKHLGMELQEIDGWNCCGATSYMSVRELMAYSISARNLSLAQRMGNESIVAPCSACFTILRKTDHYLKDIPDLRKNVNTALGAAGLSYDPGSVTIKHLLEVVCAQGGYERIRERVKNPLKGLKVAPYYGCQIVRPEVEWDDPEFPTALDDLIRALGGDPVYYPVKSRCCGASQMASSEDLALRLCKNLLLSAQQNGAECIVTVCPLCQMNLDAFQTQINDRFGTSFKLPILYFTQLMGVAMGIPMNELGVGSEIVPAASLLSRYADMSKALPAPKEA